MSSSAVIDHFGGDLWVIPTGLEVLDNAEVISVAPRNILLSHPCVKDVRGLVYGYVSRTQNPKALETLPS